MPTTTQREGGSLRPSDPPALRRLVELDLTPTSVRRSEQVEEHARRTLAAPVRRRGPARPFGHQPGLDGLRALAVIVVILYHGGFPWIHGGWLGVEVFFVVSGFLITTLLLEERERTGRVALGSFWVRRARRLLPALGVMLVAVAAVTLAVGSAAQRGELRRDLPWSIFYLGNWGQIVGGIPYYAADPPLLRHLWSLAIEEQFYLVWPLVFLALARTGWSNQVMARLLGGTAVVVMVWVFWLHAGGPGPVGVFGGVDRVNVMYLSTFTRAGGLLLGCAAAFVWRPWRTPAPRADRDRQPGRVLDVVGGLAIGMLACIASVAVLTDGYVYQWLLPLISVLSLVAVLVAVHPAALGMRRVLGCRPLVAVGVRSYGLYLWHWPIFVLVGATTASVTRFAIAVVLTVVLAELSYRYVEVPVRQGALSQWWRTAGDERGRPVLVAACAVGLLASCYVAVDPFDRAAGGDDATFDAPATSVVPATTVAGAALPAPVVPVTPAPAAPRRVVIVGDSQAHALAVNLPDGIESTFAVTDGGLDGCSVYDAGRVRSSRASFDNSFLSCAGWADKWAASVSDADAEIALVVLGAWDVFDLEQGDGTWLVFGTPAWDAYVREQLQTGIDAVAAAGAAVALLEVPCMRPVPAEGAAVPPLPERGDDAHVAHVNELFRSVAAANAGTVTFVEGPDAWCADEAVATDVGMRWDGVHVYTPGAKLIYDTIAPALLAVPLAGR